MLALQLLGPLEITFDAKSVVLESVKVRALLIYLALERDHAHARDELIGLLWGEQGQERARVNLRRALWNLQHALKTQAGAPFLLATRETIQFNPAAEAHGDALEFRALLVACQAHAHRAIETCRACIERLERAITLYRGEFLPNFFVPDAPAFEEWVLLQREYLHRCVITALTQVTAYYEQMGAAGFVETERYARRQIELEAWGEEPYRALMRTYVAQNQSEQAIAAYHALASVLHHELNLEPSAETTALYKHLRDQSSVASRQSTVINHPSTASNLPLPSTPLVGRESELAEIGEKITRADCRLLTLVGQGGIGKTRLALETARANRHSFPRGAYFVDLAAVVSPEMIPHAIIEAMHLNLRSSASSAEQLLAHLQDLSQPLLLILDNLEQLLVNPAQVKSSHNVKPSSAEHAKPRVSVFHANAGAVRFVSELLKRAPHVALLATSRERLNLAGEWLFNVEGLRAPAMLPAELQSDWDAAEAVQLFVQCAARLDVDAHAWSKNEKRAVIRITQLVEGMPLAIELAAAWLTMLSPVEIADEIAHSLDILSRAHRDLPARHASIRAVFEHSWELLTPTEQDAFARMSIFRGGFTREAARQVTNAPLPILSALVEKSLVKRAAAGRFRLHELVRQFAAEKLEQGTAPDAARQQHIAYYLNWLIAKASAFNSDDARASLAELRREDDNLRAAWQWAVAQCENTLLLRALPALTNFYLVAGLVPEGDALLRETITALDTVNARRAMNGDAEPSDRAALSLLLAMTQTHLAHLLLRSGNFPDTIVGARRALDLVRLVGNTEYQVMAEWILGAAIERNSRDPEGSIHVENALATAEQANLTILQAHILFSVGENLAARYMYVEARPWLTRALKFAAQTNEKRLESDILTLLARVAFHELNATECEDLLQRALLLKRKLGDPNGEVTIYVMLGNLALLLYQLDRALDWKAQAATLAREIGDQIGQLYALSNRASVLQIVGKYAEARAAYLENLSRAKQTGETWVIYTSLYWLAQLEVFVGDPSLAMTYAQDHAVRAESKQDELEIAQARERMADAHLALGNLVEAETLYQQALPVYHERQKHGLVLCCHVGLARIALMRGDAQQTLALAHSVRDALLEKFPHIDTEPLRLFLVCYQVLRACGDANADELLRHAHARLQYNAAQIQDQAVRTSYLENVPWHREIQRDFTRLEAPRLSPTAQKLRVQTAC